MNNYGTLTCFLSVLLTGSDLIFISHKSEALCLKSDPSNAFATSMFTLNSRNASEDLKLYKLWYGLSHLKFWRSRSSDNQETLKVQMFWWCRRLWRSRSWIVESLMSRSNKLWRPCTSLWVQNQKIQRSEDLCFPSDSDQPASQVPTWSFPLIRSLLGLKVMSLSKYKSNCTILTAYLTFSATAEAGISRTALQR